MQVLGGADLLGLPLLFFHDSLGKWICLYFGICIEGTVTRDVNGYGERPFSDTTGVLNYQEYRLNIFFSFDRHLVTTHPFAGLRSHRHSISLSSSSCIFGSLHKAEDDSCATWSVATHSSEPGRRGDRRGGGDQDTTEAPNQQTVKQHAPLCHGWAQGSRCAHRLCTFVFLEALLHCCDPTVGIMAWTDRAREYLVSGDDNEVAEAALGDEEAHAVGQAAATAVTACRSWDVELRLRYVTNLSMLVFIFIDLLACAHALGLFGLPLHPCRAIMLGCDGCTIRLCWFEVCPPPPRGSGCADAWFR
ncbi:hypothetical protein CC79DRAFT_748739 [Sarocladium strictum]